MFQYSGFDPVALQVGPLAIRWYGLMYLVGFATAWWLMRLRAHRAGAVCTVAQVDDLIFYGAIGVIIGGRCGYVLFYNWSAFIAEPLSLFYIWQGGMSFHGGLLGVLLAMFLFGRKIDRSFLDLMDFIAPVIPVGLGAGRIGNFINGELWGRPGDVPWAMQIHCGDVRFGDLCFRQLDLPPGTVLTPPLHPTSLYEAFLEGLVLFIILWTFSAKPRPRMAVSGLFLLGYGVFRSMVEFVRLPDSHIDYLAFDWVTMGHVLTLPMIFAGIICLLLAYRRTNDGWAKLKGGG